MMRTRMGGWITYDEAEEKKKYGFIISRIRMIGLKHYNEKYVKKKY